MAGNLLGRYVWLLEVIESTPNITLEQISERWMRSSLNENKSPLPERTFHNHKEAIKTVFGINIVCHKHTNSYNIEESFGTDQTRNWLLNSLAVSNTLVESRDLGNRIELEIIPSGQYHLPLLIQAIRDQIAVRFSYHNFWKQTNNERVLEPYMLKVFRQRWYVIGLDRAASKIKIFALDRISELDRTKEHFNMPSLFNPANYFACCYGIVNIEETSACKIMIRVYGGQVHYFREVPLHHSQEEVEITPEYSVFHYWMKPTYDLRCELQFRGNEVEVIAPQHFRQEIINELKKIILRYE